MSTTFFFWSLLSLACGDKDKDDTGHVGDGGGSDGGGSDGGTADCEATVVGITPADGDLYAALDTSVVVELTEPDPTAVVTLVDGTGAAVVGSQVMDDEVVTFTPAAPLESDAEYTVQVSWCLGEVESSFSTYTWSDPLGWDPRGLVWALDLESMEWEAPAGAGDLLLGESAPDMLIAVDAYYHRLGMLWGWSTYDGVEQDECVATTSPELVSLEGLPEFTMGPVDGTFDVWGLPLLVHDLVLTGRFGVEMEPLRALRLRAVADMREWGAVGEVLGVKDPGELCKLVGSFGDYCMACADGALYCVPIDGTATRASQVDSSIVARSAEEIAHDADCPD